MPILTINVTTKKGLEERLKKISVAQGAIMSHLAQCLRVGSIKEKEHVGKEVNVLYILTLMLNV